MTPRYSLNYTIYKCAIKIFICNSLGKLLSLLCIQAYASQKDAIGCYVTIDIQMIVNGNRSGNAQVLSISLSYGYMCIAFRTVRRLLMASVIP